MKHLSKLSKQARDYIKTVMRDNGQMTTDEAIEIVEPHYMFDPQTAKQAEIRRVVHNIMRNIKGETGKRACFSLEAASGSLYINIETTTAVHYLDGVEKQINQKYYGLKETKKRIAKRRYVLTGQLSLPEFDG